MIDEEIIIKQNIFLLLIGFHFSPYFLDTYFEHK